MRERQTPPCAPLAAAVCPPAREDVWLLNRVGTEALTSVRPKHRNFRSGFARLALAVAVFAFMNLRVGGLIT